MDKEKDNLNPNDTEELKDTVSKESENESPDNTDKYYDEMEELKNIFKHELKKAQAEADSQEDEEDSKEEFKEYEVEGYDPKSVSLGESANSVTYAPEELCECCGERPRGTRRNPDSPYCEECEVLLEKYPYDFKGIIVAVLVIGIAIASLVTFTQNVGLFSKMKMGDKAMANNKIYTAIAKYEDANGIATEMKYTDCNRLLAKRMNASYCLVDMAGLAEMLDDSIVSSAMLNLPAFKNTKIMREEIIEMFGSIENIEKVLSNHKDMNFKAIIDDLSKLSGKKIYYQNDKYYFEGDEDFKSDGTEKTYICNEGWINLYKYSAAQASEQDKETMLQYLKGAYDNGSNYLKRLVTPLLASTYIGTGHYDEATPLVDVIREFNAEGPDAYMIKAMLYRYRDKDYKSAINTCDDGLKNITNLPNGDELVKTVGYMLSMQKSLNLVMQAEDLKGDERIAKLKEALDFAGDAYANSGTIQARDFYAIVALSLNNKEVFDALQKEITDMGEDGAKFTEDVTNYKDGKITLSEIAMSGRYDIQ